MTYIVCAVPLVESCIVHFPSLLNRYVILKLIILNEDGETEKISVDRYAYDPKLVADSKGRIHIFWKMDVSDLDTDGKQAIFRILKRAVYDNGVLSEPEILIGHKGGLFESEVHDYDIHILPDDSLLVIWEENDKLHSKNFEPWTVE